MYVYLFICIKNEHNIIICLINLPTHINIYKKK